MNEVEYDKYLEEKGITVYEDLANTMELDRLSDLMEKMAGYPKEQMGKRQPGEKCMYEIQRKNKHEF